MCIHESRAWLAKWRLSIVNGAPTERRTAHFGPLVRACRVKATLKGEIGVRLTPAHRRSRELQAAPP
jgi:hypothetical protein